ncbi:MAG: DUF2384 domain-containing protein, partial [Actinomycetota bacterium]|nr:DUF2384 domain-containing protein [Actinomycetota bacterium]
MSETTREGARPDGATGKTPTDLSKFRNEVLAKAGEGGGANPYVILLGLEPLDAVGLARRVEEGLSYRTLEHLMTNAGFTREAMADLVRIKPRTLDRRKKSGRLEPEESDRLLRVSRVLGQAIGLFEGDAAAARRWLSSPKRALGGVAPLNL